MHADNIVANYLSGLVDVVRKKQLKKHLPAREEAVAVEGAEETDEGALSELAELLAQSEGDDTDGEVELVKPELEME